VAEVDKDAFSLAAFVTHMVWYSGHPGWEAWRNAVHPRVISGLDAEEVGALGVCDTCLNAYQQLVRTCAAGLRLCLRCMVLVVRACPSAARA